MKIVVAIKQVPDTATQVKISGGDPKAIDTTGITWIVSPYDEFAIEEALRIKEKRGQGEVIALSLGPDRVKEALRSALAMGCDRAIHLNDPAWTNADHAGHRAGARRRDQAGAARARVLRPPGDRRRPWGRWARSWPRCSTGRARRGSWKRPSTPTPRTCAWAARSRAGSRVFDLPLPAVLSAQKGLNEPRYPTLKGIMGAKKKEIKDMKPGDIGLTPAAPQLAVKNLEALPARPPGRIVQGEVKDAVKELVRALREDAKAI